ncbi:MAG: transglycosylase SLT domain-containing protein [Humidesulfovibrio sp.]|uniref:transglycosylase SLT domain-containing protein n=1 Tax=Humidesulfovibrio sp. TaxID=2910988 RepID=UPI0027EF817E|nr:transglycosylase SLT domain-containing protein [Humidesulfovibrio sp.]MDQ7835480.1 transglycosylase SLT domain-containing protein [Humidesulfovibrio sp.]
MATQPGVIVIRWALRAVLVLLLAGIFASVLSMSTAHGWGDIPAACYRYKDLMRKAALAEAGPDAPVALFMAQMTQESGCNPEAVSPVGARGLAQFMPATARDMGRQRTDLGPALPTNPVWAARALCAYDLQNKRRIKAASDFDLWAMTLSAYNGGLGWVYRDQALAEQQGYDRARWWGHVDKVNAGRSVAAWRENRGYPQRIMRRLMPVYEAAGWGRGVAP